MHRFLPYRVWDLRLPCQGLMDGSVSEKPPVIAGLTSWTTRIFSMVNVLAICLVVGCQPEPQITQYEIPKAEAIQLPLPEGMKAPPAGGTAATAGQPQRMLGAIVPHKDQFWFFKLSGDVDVVAQQTEEFRSFIESLTFNQRNEPEWTLPAKWTQKAGSGMRFSTVTIDSAPGVEMSVIALPTGNEPLPPQILANVNRWRGQLSLPPLEASQLDDESTEVLTKSKETATLVDFTGISSGTGMMNAPFARGTGVSVPPEAAGQSEPTAVELTYDVPEGWKPGKSGGLRKAAFEIEENNQKAEVTVINLAASAGARLPNINRWRGQIGLPETTEADLKTEMKAIDVGPLKGDYVELVGDPSAARPQTILGVIVEHRDQSWFIKLQGDSELAATQRQKFEEFAQSVKFE